MSARSPKYSGRLRPPATVSGQGEDEVEALHDLATRLRDLRDVERRMAIEQKAPAACLRGGDASRPTLGRPLTQDELEALLARYRTDTQGRRDG